ncbi:MAG: hypothetical protein KF912_10410 [Phycisphaeraceae bacterium]|nr:hypothetical protein [Phycisphaeraceae bacterium]MBX3367710.1 hypothetical protein [Phycisphaeraceae bacterium]
MTSPPAPMIPTPDLDATVGSPVDIVWPADRFFWGTLEAPGVRRSGPLPPAMALSFADDVPVPLEDLHPVMAPLSAEGRPSETSRDSGRILVCAARRADLMPLVANARSLRPATLPPFLEGVVDPGAINLLVGAFEPWAALRKRQRTITGFALLWTVLALATGVGLFRRSQAWQSHAADLRTARTQAIENALPGLTVMNSGMEMELSSEIERTQRALNARSGAERPTDVSGTLAAILRSWPVDIETPHEVQSVTLNAGRVAISVLVAGDPTSLIERLPAPVGWHLKEPRLTQVGSSTRLSIELVPVAQATGPTMEAGR